MERPAGRWISGERSPKDYRAKGWRNNRSTSLRPDGHGPRDVQGQMTPDPAGADLPIRIVVRTNVDWRSMSDESFASQDDPNLPVARIRAVDKGGVLDLWRGSFAISFFEYRHRLREVALESLRNAGADHLTLGLEHFEEWYSTDQDEILVCIDDDDFMGPSMDEVRKMFTEDTDVLIWPQGRWGFAPGSSVRSFHVAPLPIIGPVNAALRKSYLQRILEPSEVPYLLAHHRVTNSTIAEAIGADTADTALLDAVMLTGAGIRNGVGVHGMYNVHVGSVAFLHDALRTPDPARYLGELDLGNPSEIPVAFEDFEPYIRAFEALSADLR